ncbi:MAG: Lycopene cyclase [Chloroflexi bacterium]|nr:Lycopene cyclase [Chloroflexota bacterium]
MQPYDFIIAGGGVAGLSLAYALIHSPLRDRSVLIVERDDKTRNDRTLSFWSDRPTPFDDIVYRAWDRLRVAGEDCEQVFDLGVYRYQVIRGIDFYRFVHRALADYPNVTLLRGTVERIEDGPDAASVIVEGRRYAGRWVFDSVFTLARFRPDPAACTLRQHFRGWLIETDEDVFDPQAATFMDFRTPQQQDVRFFYVLPFSRRQALVEYVLHGPDQTGPALHTYIRNVLGVRRYRIVWQESGVTPLTDWRFPRRAGQRVMTIGVQGGRVKPSTGYAFARILDDSQAIVRSLVHSGQPFDVPDSPWFYYLCDKLMLHVMKQRAEAICPLLIALFRHNPIERVFRFLNESTAPLANLLLTGSLVPAICAQAIRIPHPWRGWRSALGLPGR